MAEEVVFSTRGAEQVAAAQEKLNKKHRESRQAVQLTNAETKNLGQITTRVLREIELPQEKYLRKMREAKVALAGQKNSVELLARAEKKFAAEWDTALDKTKGKMKGLDEQSTTTFSSKRLAGFAAGFVSIQKAVALITDELRAQQELIDKRAAAQLTVSESRNLLLRNLDESKPDEIRRTLAGARDIASQTGVSEAAINAALADAVSSTSGNVPLSLKLVSLAARFLKDRPGEVGGFAGTLADLTRVTGSTNPETQLGLLRRVGQLSRIVKPELQAKNIAPALIGTIPFGGDAATSGALFSALTGGGADKTGEQTGTALIGIAAQLEQATLGTKTFKATKTSPGPIEGLAGTRSLRERIAYLQRNPDDAAYFLEKGSFEKKVLGPITQLLTDPSSLVARDYAANLGKIPDNAGLASVGKRSLGIFGEFNAIEPVAERGRRLAAAAELLQTRAASPYLSTTELESLRTVVLETGGTSTGERFNKLLARAKGGGKVHVDEAVGILETRLQRLEHPTVPGGLLAGENVVAPPTNREATEAERAQAEILREQLRLLKESLKEQKETNAAIKNAPPAGLVIGGE